MRALLLSVALLPALLAQDAPPKPKQTVVYVAEPLRVPPGKRADLALRFRVVEGYHVNSHLPRSDFLIPTVLQVQPASGVTSGATVYSPGQEYSFAFSPNEKLDVYSGEFTVKLPVTAAAGEHTLDATLHYQACDRAACYPPKSLPLQVLFTAK